MSRLPVILVGISLCLLTSFLGYWIYRSYQEAYASIETKFHFDVAKQLLKGANINLPEVLDSLSNTDLKQKTSVKILLSKFSMDSDTFLNFVKQNWQDSLADTNLYQETKVFIHSDDSLKYSFRQRYTSQELKRLFSQVGLSKVSNPKSPNNDHTLLIDAQQANQATFFKVLIYIWPQIVTACFLLGITICAIWILNRSHQREQLLLETKNAFISNMAHELRTPITTIGLALEAIQNYTLEYDVEQSKKYLTTSSNQLNRLSNLVDQLLNIVRAKEGTNFYQHAKIDLNEVVKSSLMDMETQIVAQRAIVQEKLLRGPIWILGDILHLTNAIQNLIDNALKYNSAGVKIEIKTNVQGKRATLQIMDSGVGIPVAHKHRVFEQFYRVPTGDVHDIKGYGLGLSYVKQTIEAHKGKVLLQSEENKGTTITMMFPLLEGDSNYKSLE